MFTKVRKKPVVVEAALWDPTEPRLRDAVLTALTEAQVSHYVINESLVIRTLEGDMTAGPGDFIIKGVKREFYPCKPDIFNEIYEVATPTHQVEFGIKDPVPEAPLQEPPDASIGLDPPDASLDTQGDQF